MPQLAHENVILIILIICFNSMPKMKSFYLWVAVPTVIYMQAIISDLYKFPKPFQADTAISNQGFCDITFGAPNYECMITSFLWISIYLGQYYEVGEPAVRFQSVMCTGYIVKMGVQAAIFIMLSTLGFAMMYNGMATYDQILLGLFLGSAFAFLGHYVLKIHFKWLPVYISRPQKYYLRKLICPFRSVDMNANYHEFFVSLKLLGSSIFLFLIVPFSIGAFLWNSQKNIKSIDIK